MSIFCICKSYSHFFFSKNTYELDIVLTRTVNILITIKLVKLTMLWTTGPRLCNPDQIVKYLNWETLKDRRKSSRITRCTKSPKVDVEPGIFIQNSDWRTRGQAWFFQERTVPWLQKFFFSREWNCLPITAKEASFLKSFRRPLPIVLLYPAAAPRPTPTKPSDSTARPYENSFNQTTD